jgi:uracil phosphoribosyltransferase
MVFELDKVDSVATTFLEELRTGYRTSDPFKFRYNMERIGQIMAYEISKTLTYTPVEITTPLGIKTSRKVSSQVVLGTVLRAGLPFYQGFLNYFDKAGNAFVGAYRIEGNSDDLLVEMEYSVSCSLDGKVLIIVDPMIASGKSLVTAIKSLLEKGKPTFVHIASIIAAPEGINYIRENITIDKKIWTGSLDSHLNEDYFIVPGLGDAGDLAFGSKV